LICLRLTSIKMTKLYLSLTIHRSLLLGVKRVGAVRILRETYPRFVVNRLFSSS
jgi:hypothetical protein